MSKVALTTHNGGLEGAVESYKYTPTPNLIIFDSSLPTDEVPLALDRLAEVCDASTRLIVLGHVNVVLLFRELIRSGVSEYLVLPTSAQSIVYATSDLSAAEGAAPIGRTIGVIAAKGGAGASTVAHNVAWAISQHLRQDVLILDMDLPFGTAGLNFNQDPPHGIAAALGASGKVDPPMLDRLLSKAANHINLLPAPAMLDKTFDYGERDFEQVLELAQKTTPAVVLDLPHNWTAWVRHTLATIDEIVIVAEPDLANLRNAKNLADSMKALRPNEAEPLLVINQLGVPKRPEIAPKEFAASVECKLLGQIAFDPATFGTAANNGQMLAEVSANNRATEIFRVIGMHVTGRSAPEVSSKGKPAKLGSLLKLK